MNRRSQFADRSPLARTRGRWVCAAMLLGLLPVLSCSKSSPTDPPADVPSDVVDEINAARAGAGLPPFREDARLTQAAASHSNYMAAHDCFSHQCPGEADATARIKSTGYPLRTGSEDIAVGYSSATAVVEGWMGNPGHRAALLGSFDDIGCSWVVAPQSSYRYFWTCDFASR